jgi:hypothetical protein
MCVFKNLPFATAWANCYSEIAYAILDETPSHNPHPL